MRNVERSTLCYSNDTVIDVLVETLPHYETNYMDLIAANFLSGF
ncbi:hypothetical protein OA39_01484 [Vibrio campbellii]|uniref:Uncharacterized protein n=1 Tax=Vibrio campbellii (strain ATCC BAA-1116) TaxID=2902295 RepID=A7N6A1_VIBC1|nr:hypothetical protein VIBHAR_05167 [Vibrio campbellii ATCC BAA-1116]AQM71232.1 hypothetical protein Vca1114GL_04815 [Vibrio campbellii]CAD7820872.1 hypothetical protein ACOMICROBIO_LMKGKHOH_04648 [Vibrio sp. B1FIG11]ARR08467.1 hypothetical protein Vc3S01_A0494 [Vibrio campbellii]KGR36381.1 hypothetical protein OA39_01484 [Vibrio campbellii]